MEYEIGIKKVTSIYKNETYRINNHSYVLAKCDSCRNLCFIRKGEYPKETLRFCNKVCKMDHQRSLTYNSTTKLCFICYRFRAHKEFSPRLRNKTGLRSYCRDCRRAYTKEERADMIAKTVIREKKRRASPKYRLESRMGTGLRRALLGVKNSRSWQEFVDYNLDELLTHLKSTLPKGYTMNDLDKLHIDHIIPRSFFSYSFNVAKTAEEIKSDPQFKECWALENLQLLTIKDNLSKGSKFI